MKIFLSLSLLATFVGAVFSTKILADVNKNIAAAKETARSANVKIIKITAARCSDCFNVNGAVLDFKKLNVKVDEEKNLSFDSPSAKTLIKKFDIKKIPTYLVSGEVTKNNLESFIKKNGEIKDRTFIFTKVIPLFIDTASGQETGKVTATLLTDTSCSECQDLTQIIESFKKAGVKMKDIQTLEWNSTNGQNLINKYKITKIPAFIFSPEFDLYDKAKANWVNFGTIEEDKTFIARNISLPYRDLEKGQITGLVDVIYLTDSSCTDCYDVQNVQKPILTNGYGVVLRSARTIDTASSEGQDLINRYGITKVPTVLLSPEAGEYLNLKNIWKSVGKVETDGWYAFTELNQLGKITYKDLTNNQIIRPVGQISPSPTK